MSGTHPEGLKPADTRAHGVVEDALARGFKESGEPYWIPNLPSHAVANESRLSVGRALVHLNLSRTDWVTDSEGKPCYRDCVDADAPHGVKFRCFSKSAGRRHIVAQAAGDPANLKYNPFAKKRKPPFDDDGNPHQN